MIGEGGKNKHIFLLSLLRNPRCNIFPYMLYVWNIDIIYNKFKPNVGKYPGAMEHMGFLKASNTKTRNCFHIGNSLQTSRQSICILHQEHLGPGVMWRWRRFVV